MADQRTTDDAAPLKDITPVCDEPFIPRKLLYSGIAIVAIVVAAVVAVSI